MRRILPCAAALAVLGLAACNRGTADQARNGPQGPDGMGVPGGQYGSQAWQVGQNQGPPAYPPGAYPPQGPAPPPQGPYPPPGGYPPQGPYPPPGPQGPLQGGYPVPPPSAGPATWPPGPTQAMGAPPGMQPLPTQAGHVFTTQLNGSPQASKMVQAMMQGAQGYFDGPPRILNTQTDPSDRMSRVDFANTLRGQPVMGMFGVQSDGRNAGIGYLLFDTADRVQQTMPMMMAATQRGPGG